MLGRALPGLRNVVLGVVVLLFLIAGPSIRRTNADSGRLRDPSEAPQGEVTHVLTVALFKKDRILEGHDCLPWSGSHELTAFQIVSSRGSAPELFQQLLYTTIGVWPRIVSADRSPVLRLRQRLGFSEQETTEYPVFEVIVDRISFKTKFCAATIRIRSGMARVFLGEREPVVTELGESNASIGTSLDQWTFIEDSSSSQRQRSSEPRPIGSFCLRLGRRHTHRDLAMAVRIETLTEWRRYNPYDPVKYDPVEPLPFNWSDQR